MKIKLQYEDLIHEFSLRQGPTGNGPCLSEVCSYITSKLEIPVAEQILSFGETLLSDRATLVHLGIVNGSTLLLKRRFGKKDFINDSVETVVKDKYDNEYYYYTESGTKVCELKPIHPIDIKDKTLVSLAGQDMITPTNNTFYIVPKNAQVLFVTTAPVNKIYTKNFTPKTYCLYYEEETTISELKKQIQIKTGFIKEAYNLSFKGEKLTDLRTVASYNLKNGDALEFGFNVESQTADVNSDEPPIKKQYKYAVDYNLGIAINISLGIAFVSACGFALLKKLSSSAYISDIVPSAKICLAISSGVSLLCGAGFYMYKARADNDGIEQR